MSFLSTATPGLRVILSATGRTGTITRVIATSGALGGIAEVRWDGQRAPSRTSGFFGGDELAPLAGPVRHRTGLVVLG